MLIKGFVACLLVVFSLVSYSVYAEMIPIKDPDVRTIYWRTTYRANPDYSYEETHDIAIKVLNKRAIQRIKSRSISYSASIETVDIIDAHTLKANGASVPVPPDNYQVRTNAGRGDDAPVFSDRASIRTVFPELEVGDTLVFKYKRSVKEPMFPGYFTAGQALSPSMAADEVVFDLFVPDTFNGLHQTRQMQERIEHRDGISHYRWSWKNTNPVRDSRQDYSVIDLEANPGFSYSTFSSYQAIAQAYGRRASPKAKVTPRVEALAKKIIGSEQDKKEQARLAYEWVATKISYAGNCVGVGAVVPHDLSFVLDNHMGDCKDHATLLEALLNSLGIDSEQALVNSGSVYSLPSIPAVNSVNHVINYLPQWDLFVDSTSSTTPFGMLPESVEGKPVLLVKNFIKGKKTPVAEPGSHYQHLQADLTISEEGAISGTVKIDLKGAPAVIARSGWRDTSKDAEEQWLDELFTNNGRIGHASIEKDDPRPLEKSFHYTMTFDQKEFLLSDSAGAFAVYSPIPSYQSVADMIYVAEQIEEVPVKCSSGKSEETLVYRFPANFRILDYPKSKVIDGKFLHYEASYGLADNVLTVRRLIEDQTPGPVCTPELMAAQKTTLQKISRHLRSQIVYKPLWEDE